MKLLSLILFVPTFSIAQVTFSGKLTVCKDFKTNFSVRNQLHYKRVKDRKTKQIFLRPDTIQASIYLHQGDSLIKHGDTDYKGNFSIALPENTTHKVRFSVVKGIYKDTVFNSSQNVSGLIICISDTAYQNTYLRRIPFDSLRAKKDIANDTVRLVELRSTIDPSTYQPILDKYDIRILEDEFGFKYDYHDIEAYQEHLDQRAREYNSIVYRYLSEKLHGDAARMIMEKKKELVMRKRGGELR